MLAVFKYVTFIDSNIRGLAHFIGWNYPEYFLNIILPIGLSFHTFQAMSYTIEVYRGRQSAERHFGIFALYVMFYPQLVAGPIERPQNLLPQFRERHSFDYQSMVAGLQLIAWGLFKKMVIADRLALYVDPVYNNPADHFGLPVILAIYFFAFQIYCDFSGYSDIAIGAAQVMGFKLMNNFRQPYLSQSIPEFWRRWHISLSTWFKDYLYIPLGGNQGSRWRISRNLMIVFLVSGLWHGASWTFVVWGALHGLFMIIWQAVDRLRMKRSSHESHGTPPQSTRRRLVALLGTFHLVTFSWIFFRATSLEDAFQLIQHMLVIDFNRLQLTIPGFNHFQLLIALLALMFLICVEIIDDRFDFRTFLSARPRWLRWGFYQLVILLILIFGVFHQTAFIYFQF
jgi:D-alanyl-lipoteichoic acid acyltransferase DltB (MBOAT superfamily)